MPRGIGKIKDDRFAATVVCNKCGHKELNKHFDPDVTQCGDCMGDQIEYRRGHMECRHQIKRQPGRPKAAENVEEASEKICGSSNVYWPGKLPSKCNNCGGTDPNKFEFVYDEEAMRWFTPERKFVPADQYVDYYDRWRRKDFK